MTRRRGAAPPRRRAGGALRRSGSHPAARPAGPTPLPRPAAPAAPTEFSDAVAIQFRRRCRRAPASPTSSSATARTPWISGSPIWPARSPSVHRPRKRGNPPNDTGEVTESRATTGRMVGHLQAAASRKLGRPVHARTVPACRFLGLGRVLARAWQQARSDGWYSIYVEPEVVHGRRPDGEDGARHSRHRADCDRLGAVASRLSRPRELGGEPSHPAATRA